MTVNGKGGYYTKGGQYQRGFDPTYGSQLGSVIGSGLQSLAEVLGFGDYEIRQNSLMNSVVMGTDPPTVRNLRKGEATVFTHREYLGDLRSAPFPSSPGATSPFQVASYPINPGNPDLFPWLATIASNFQEWELNGMLIELKSISSSYAANLSMGSMFAATQYNVLAPPPTSKIQIENTEYASSSKPSASLIHAIECARGNDTLTHLYVATDSDVLGGGDARLYNLGNVYIGSYGIPESNAPIAEIWVTYEVSLYKPTLPLTVGQFDTAHYYADVVDATFPQSSGGFVALTGSSDVIGLTTVNTGGTTASYNFTFPNRIARYLVTIAFNLKTGSQMSNTSWGFSSGSHDNCQLYYGWSDPVLGENGVNITATRNLLPQAGILTGGIEFLHCAVIFDVPALTSGVSPVGRLTYTASTGVPTCSGDIWISQISTNVL